jgi:hypothetical protein
LITTSQTRTKSLSALRSSQMLLTFSHPNPYLLLNQ